MGGEWLLGRSFYFFAMSKGRTAHSANAPIRRGGASFRAVIAVAAVSLSMSGLSEADNAEPTTRKPTKIPAEDLRTALRTLESDRGLEVIFVAEDVRGVRTKGASGNLTLQEALDKTLADTGLTYHYVDNKTVIIVPARSTPHRSSAVANEAGPTTAKVPAPLQEVIVAAQRRQMDVRNQPYSISDIGGLELEEFGATRLSDYAAHARGLNVVQGAAAGQDTLIVRALGVPAPTALIGVYIDDTPVGASSAFLQTSRHALDLPPYDFEQFEVLEGPQGTLYGANNMGGLIKYVTRKPDLNNVTARVGVDFRENGDASQAGWSVHNSVNLPIATGRAALRASLSADVVPGFIDEPNQHRTNGNQEKSQAGRLALLLEPSDAWSVDLSTLIQHRDSPDGATITLTSDLTPDTGRLSNSEPVPQTHESRLQYYSARITGHLPAATFIGATSYSSMQTAEWQQVHYQAEPPSQRTVQGNQFSLRKLTQELRVTSAGGSRLDWRAGAFFTDERGNQIQSAYALDTSNRVLPNPQVNPEIYATIPSRYREYAVFGDTTWRFNSALELTVGVRESRNEQTSGGSLLCSQVYVSTIDVCPPVRSPISATQNVFNFLISPSYHFSRDVLAHLRLASGYRPGGPNVPVRGIPTSVAADTLIDSEFGIKSTWFDRKLRFDASLYRIDWNHIQIVATAPAFGSINYGANGNSATVSGFEMETIFAPLSTLRFEANLTHTRAVLSAPIPSSSTLAGNRGDRLPYAPLWSGSITADYTRALLHGWIGTVGADWRYTGQRYTAINNPGNCPINCAGATRVPTLMPYGVADMHAGVSNDEWSVRFSVRNITNKYALVDVNGGGARLLDLPPIIATVLSGRLFTLGAEFRF